MSSFVFYLTASILLVFVKTQKLFRNLGFCHIKKIFEAVQASARSQCLDQRNCDGSKIWTFYQDLFWSWTMPQIKPRKQEYYSISFVRNISSVKIYFSTVNRRLIEIYCQNWDHIKIIDHREMFSMRFSPRSESYLSWWWFLLKTIKKF